jgi:hypothetical protein
MTAIASLVRMFHAPETAIDSVARDFEKRQEPSIR